MFSLLNLMIVKSVKLLVFILQLILPKHFTEAFTCRFVNLITCNYGSYEPSSFKNLVICVDNFFNFPTVTNWLECIKCIFTIILYKLLPSVCNEAVLQHKFGESGNQEPQVSICKANEPPSLYLKIMSETSEWGHLVGNIADNRIQESMPKVEIQDQMEIPLNFDVLYETLFPYVQSVSGIQGLLKCRSVCRLWNEAATRLCNTQPIRTSVHQLPAEEHEDNVWERCESEESIPRMEPTLQRFVDFLALRDHAAITKTILNFSYFRLYKIRTGIHRLVQPHGPGTEYIRTLHLSDFSARQYNCMISRILEALPKLSTLKLDVSRPAEEFPEELQAEGDPQALPQTFKSSLSCLQLVITRNVRNAEELRCFDWHFATSCPNLKNLSINWENDSCFTNNNSHPVVKFFSDLQSLLPQPPLESYATNSQIQYLQQQFGEFINHFSIKNFEAKLSSQQIRQFLLSINPDKAAKMESLDFYFIGSRNGYISTLLQSLGDGNFSGLKFLALELQISGYDPEESVVHQDRYPGLESIEALDVSSTAYSSEVGNNNREREMIAFYGILSHFPNLKDLRVTLHSVREAEVLFSSLHHLECLRYLALREDSQCSPYLTNKLLFGEDEKNPGCTGIVKLSQIRRLRITYDRRRKLFDESSANGFAQMEGLQSLIITKPWKMKTAQHLLDNLPRRIRLTFTD